LPEAPVTVGVAGWTYEDWKGVVYPARTQDRLAFMADRLDCLEINSSFYKPFDERIARAWVQSVSHNPRFRFSAKVWSRLTHETDKPLDPADIQTFLKGPAALKSAGRLLSLLLQFPFYFKDTPSHRERLQLLADGLRAFPTVLEVRDASWAQPQAIAFIHDLGLNIACLDMPLASDSFRLDAAATGPLGYLRLHGRNAPAWFKKDSERDDKYNYLYTPSEMDEIIQRIQRLRQNADAVAVVWNNHYRGKAAVNAFQTLHALTGEKVAVPETLQAAYPELMRIARTEKGMLF